MAESDSCQCCGASGGVIVRGWDGLRAPLCATCRAVLGMDFLIRGPRRGRRDDRQWATTRRRWLLKELAARRARKGLP